MFWLAGQAQEISVVSMMRKDVWQDVFQQLVQVKDEGEKKCLRAFSLIFYFVPLLDTQAILDPNPNLTEIHGSLSIGSIRLERGAPNVVLVIKNILMFLPALLNTTVLGRRSRYWPLYAAWAWRNHPGDSAHGGTKGCARVPVWQVMG